MQSAIPDDIIVDHTFVDQIDDHNWHFNVWDAELEAERREANRQRNIAYARTKFRLESLPKVVDFFNLWATGQQLYTAAGAPIDRPVSTLRAESLRDSALDDLDEITQYDQQAVEIQPRTKIKSIVSQRLNATTFVTRAGNIERRKDGSTFRRATIIHDHWIGDSLQRAAGNYVIVAITIPSPYGDLAVVVEATKLHLNTRSPHDRAIWKLCKGTQTMRPGSAWVYEPERMIELGVARALDPWEAETIAYRWHREQIDQKESEGYRSAPEVTFTSRPSRPVKTRTMTPAQAARFVRGMTEENRQAILDALT